MLYWAISLWLQQILFLKLLILFGNSKYLASTNIASATHDFTSHFPTPAVPVTLFISFNFLMADIHLILSRPPQQLIPWLCEEFSETMECVLLLSSHREG